MQTAELDVSGILFGRIAPEMAAQLWSEPLVCDLWLCPGARHEPRHHGQDTDRSLAHDGTYLSSADEEVTIGGRLGRTRWAKKPGILWLVWLRS